MQNRAINVEFAVGGLTIRWPELPLEQEQEQGLFGPKPQVVGAFVRGKRSDRA